VRGISIFNAIWGIAIIAILALHRKQDDALSVEALLIGLSTSLLIYHTGRSGKLLTWGSHPLLQYLGRISYSLYLIHVFVMLVVMRIGYKITGENPKAAIGWLIVTTALCFAGAHLLHLWVEKPSMNLASRFKLRKGAEEQTSVVIPQQTPQVAPADI
jgi:peptidoglycan/LPS O-acetylase OafA/YrhL